MPRYYLWNSGCQMNRADAARLVTGLEERGYLPDDRPEGAELIVLNTCVVRQSAQDKAVGRLESLRPLKGRQCGRGSGANRAAFPAQQPVILVMGCLVDDPVALAARFPYVDAFFAPSDVAGVLGYVEKVRQATPRTVALELPEVTAAVPISHGCDHHCTYCIVVLRRGAQRSRPVEEIATETQELLTRGAREISLLGQNADAYGTDLPPGAEGRRPDLADVLLAVHDLPDLRRIRFLTSHPKDLSERLIAVATGLPKVCECWELPVQSGDDDVLRRMGRGYTVARFRELVAHIRGTSRQPCAVNTDIIVGFPGESEAQFAATLRLVEELALDTVHVAAYSPRPGTLAAGWPDDVPAAEKERRRRAVEEAQTRIATERNHGLMGQEVEVLVDGRQKGRWRGRTRTNKLVFFGHSGDWLGQLVHVRVTWAGPWSLIGTLCAEPLAAPGRRETRT